MQPFSANGQNLYYQVTTWTNTTTTQTVNNTTVTITSTGGNYTIPYNFCANMPGPYLVGHFSAGNYLFSFSSPVRSVRIRVHGMQSAEVISIEINGTAYALGVGNNLIQCTACNASCQDPVGTIVAGELHGSATFSSGGEFTIENVSGGISSIKILHNGQQAGAGISLEFQEGYVHASNNGPVCWGDSLKLFGEPSSVSGGYSWTGPNGFTSTQQNPIIANPTAASAGDYILTANGLSDTTTVTLLPRPSDPVVTYDQPICAGSTLVLSCSSTPSSGVVYTWAGPNSFNATGNQATIPNIQADDNGIYQVQADINGCKSDTVKVTIEVSQPSITHLSDTICYGSTFDFNGTKINQTGTYSDTMPNAVGCDSIIFLHLKVRPPMPLSITYDHKDYCNNDTVTLTGHGAAQYAWSHPVGKLGNGQVKKVRLVELKNKFTLTATDTNGCIADTYVIINAKPCCEILIPTAFSPNQDGVNDFYSVRTTGHFIDYKLSIYDRYGQKVFVSFDPDDKWNGTINGKPANMGTYFYFLKAKCDYGEAIIKKGDLTLIK